MSEERPATAFQTKVFDALHLIPRGKVTTYGLLGNYIHCRSAQAIGQALKANPFAPGTPCHRVVKGDLSIGGYSGERDGSAIERKRKLLEAEGVVFLENGHIDPACCYNFDA